MKKRILRSVLILVAALCFSALVAWVQVHGQKTSTPLTGQAFVEKTAAEKTTTEKTVAGVSVGGPFTLTDQNGKPFTDADLRGHYTLIYFGFTFCPAICPTELQKITVALNQAGAQGDTVLPVFITIDPERDTRDIIAHYVAQFHKNMVGLTGTQAQINAVLKAYHIYAKKVKDEGMTDYTMDHSSYIYFIDPKGNLVDIYGVDSTPSEIAKSITETILMP